MKALNLGLIILLMISIVLENSTFSPTEGIWLEKNLNYSVSSVQVKSPSIHFGRVSRGGRRGGGGEENKKRKWEMKIKLRLRI